LVQGPLRSRHGWLVSQPARLAGVAAGTAGWC